MGNLVLVLPSAARGFSSVCRVRLFRDRAILAPIIAHYVFNSCSTMLSTAFSNQPLDLHRDINQIILISMVGIALLIIASTRGRIVASQ
jgi:hypothetical protein